MPKINKYVDIDTVEREAKKDLIDRHSPFITVSGDAKAGEMLAVNVKMGQEYTHPDDFDHFIESITLFDGETKLAAASFVPGSATSQTLTLGAPRPSSPLASPTGICMRK